MAELRSERRANVNQVQREGQSVLGRRASTYKSLEAGGSLSHEFSVCTLELGSLPGARWEFCLRSPLPLPPWPPASA